MSIAIDGVRIAYGRLNRAAKLDLCARSGGRLLMNDSAYRIIIDGVPGGLDAGFTDYVVAHSGQGSHPWLIYHFVTGHDVGRTFRTRDEATEWLFIDFGVPPEVWELISIAKEGHRD